MNLVGKIVLWMSVSTLGWGQASFETVQGQLKHIEQAEFFLVQTTHFKNSVQKKRFGSQKPLVASGKVFFKSPNLFKWEKKKPFRETLSFDGEKTYLYKHEDGVLYINKNLKSASASQQFSIEKMLGVITQLDFKKDEVESKPVDQGAFFVIHPKDQSLGIQKIEALVDTQAKQPFVKELKFKYPEDSPNANKWDQFSISQFQKKKIDPKIFSLKPEKGHIVEE